MSDSPNDVEAVIEGHEHQNLDDLRRLSSLGVTTIYEAQGRVGYLGTQLRPIYPGAQVAGTAVTVSVPPGDNLTIHVAIELCRPGDILLVAPRSPSNVGYIGDLIATALVARGVVGAVIDAGCRDVASLREMGFPIWSRCISSYGPEKEALGVVNAPIAIEGVEISPGDSVFADDDGVVAVGRDRLPEVIEQSLRRSESEAAKRLRYQAGESSLDVNNLRPLVSRLRMSHVAEDEGLDREIH